MEPVEARAAAELEEAPPTESRTDIASSRAERESEKDPLELPEDMFVTAGREDTVECVTVVVVTAELDKEDSEGEDDDDDEDDDEEPSDGEDDEEDPDDEEAEGDTGTRLLSSERLESWSGILGTSGTDDEVVKACSTRPFASDDMFRVVEAAKSARALALDLAMCSAMMARA